MWWSFYIRGAPGSRWTMALLCGLGEREVKQKVVDE